MGNKYFDENKSDRSDDFNAISDPQKKTESGLSDLVSSMRPDMPLATDVEPARKSIFERVNLKVVVGILLGLFIISFLGYLLAGAGRPKLEENLSYLIHSTDSTTPKPTPTQILPTSTEPKSTNIPSATATIRPTSTATQKAIVSPTMVVEAVTATSESTCREALSITLADVGQTKCVKGTVIQTVERPNAFMVIFSDQPGSFYWVSYDMVWSEAELNTCYQITGRIDRIANSPILLFNYHNMPEVCP